MRRPAHMQNLIAAMCIQGIFTPGRMSETSWCPTHRRPVRLALLVRCERVGDLAADAIGLFV
jgi:hypothetical protein